MSERHDEDADEVASGKDGFSARMHRARPADVARIVGWTAVGLVWLIVVLDLAGVLDVFGDEQIEPSSASRLPVEFLYLDDERVDAYLGQLRGGLSPTEQRSIRLTERHQAQAGFDQVVQLGGSTEHEETINRSVETNAADRFFLLESELEARFKDVDDVRLRFKSILAPRDACAEIRRLEEIKEGQILRILGANLRVPTYALALAKVAHADQFRPPGQDEVSPKQLARLAREGQRGLKRLVKSTSLGADPRLPFWLQIHPNRPKKGCQVFMPAQYSKVIDAPSMLTGPVTVVGKVVRRLTRLEGTYVDVDSEVRWESALRRSGPRVRRLLGLDELGIRTVVNYSATVEYPGLVLLPLAIYK
jgi:hypothetical protein